MPDPIATAQTSTERPPSRGSIAELEQRAKLTERSIDWQKQTGGAITFFADGHVTLEWFEAELKIVEGENLAAALDMAGAA